MGPRRRPANVVRSGNAGNSSKPSAPPKEDAPPTDGPPKPPPLFPAGYKTPIQILNEKCQKAGWERPIVESVSDFQPPLVCERKCMLDFEADGEK